MAWTPDEIKDLRQALGLTQAKFAKKLKTQRTRVTKWETGKESPSEFYQKKLDRLLNKIEEAEKYIVSGNEPASPPEGSLHQSQENYAWTPSAIQSFRRVQGWTQQQLAQACATSQDIISQWETGKYRPRKEHQKFLDKLATQLVLTRISRESELNALNKRLNALDIPEPLFHQYTALVAENHRWQYIIDKGDGWFEAKKTKDGKPWPVPDTQIADHLAGHVFQGTATRDYIFQTQPSSFAVGLKADYIAKIVDIDLDKEFIQHPGYHPIFNPGLEGVNVASGLVMYERMQAIVELFPESLVLRRPESGNLSVIFRIVPIPTWKMLKLVEKLLLVECDMELKDGEVELFQRKDRARRLPFNGAQAIIEKESMPWKIKTLGAVRGRSRNAMTPRARCCPSANKRQDLEALVNLPMIDIEAYIKEIAPSAVPSSSRASRNIALAREDEAFREEIKPQQEKQKQPDFARKASNVWHREGHFKCAMEHTVRHTGFASAKPCVLIASAKPCDSTSASPFVLHCRELLKHGLTKPKSRHAAETDLILYSFMHGLTEEETYIKISQWYQSGKTNNLSKDWANHPQVVLQNLSKHIKSYFKYLDKRGFTPYGDGIDPEAKLSLADVAYIAKVTGSDLHFGEWLFDLFVYAKQRKFTLSYIYISQRIMQSFKNGSHNYREYVDRCQKYGILTLKRGHVSKKWDKMDFSRPKVFQFNYTFQDIAPLEKGKHYREALIQIFDSSQIRARFEKKTAQRINKLRP